MWNCSWAAAAVLLLAATPARAQAANPGAPAEAAASAAMERAKRQAAGPMRVILEASKTRRKAGDAEVPAAAPESITRSVAVLTTPMPMPVPVPATVQPAAQSAAPPPPPPPPPPVAAPAVPSGVLTQMTLTSETLQGKAAAARVPGLEVGGPAATTPLPAVAGLAGLPVVPNTVIGTARIKLLNQVDPELPQRQLDEMGRNALVTVDLTIRADGSVGNVALVPPIPRGVQRAVLAALAQWRFEPLPGERVHRVQLIFNPEQ